MSVESLAQALQEAGILDKTSVEARVPRVRSGRQLLDGLIGEGLIAEQNLVTQLARALSVPRYDPKERSPEPEALALMDLHVAEEMGVLPVAVRGGGALLWVALCDPTDEQIVAEITRRTGRRVKACLIGPRELARALQQVVQTQGQPGQAPPPQPQQQQAYPPPNSGTSTGQFRIPLPSSPPPPGPQFGQMPNMMPNGMPQGMQPMPGPYPYGYPPQQQMQALQQQMMGQTLIGQTPMMGQQPPLYAQTAPPQPFSMGPPPRQADQRADEELAQVKQVVKVLTQMLVERGLLDGDDLKRRLRAERERKG